MTTRTGTHPGEKSAAELEREVEAKRAEVEDNLDALQDRLSPGQLMDQLFDYARNGNGAEFTRNLGRSVRDNPMPVALIGAGMAWLMAGGQNAPYRERRRNRDDHDHGRVGRGWGDDWYDDDDWDDRFADDEDDISGDPVAFGMTPQARGGEAPGDDGKGIAAKAGDIADGLKDRAGDLKDKALAAGEQAGDAARDARETARRRSRRLRRDARHYRDDVARRVGRYGRQAKRGFVDTLEDQPLVLGAIGVALGAALGAALPPTEREDDLMGETRDELKRRAEREGHRQVENARDVADAAYGAAKEEADRQDLSAESGKSAADTLKDKAAKVASSAKTAAEREASSKT